MQSAGLKSISAKHLAVSCQAVHLLAVLLPQLRAGLVAPVAQQRRSLLLPEFDHLMHVGEGGHAGGRRWGGAGRGAQGGLGCVWHARRGGGYSDFEAGWGRALRPRPRIPLSALRDLLALPPPSPPPPMQDLTLHMDEIHTKLVEIMQDRLLAAAKQLVTEAESWGKEAAAAPVVGAGAATGGAGDGVGDAIRSLAKQLGTLRNVLLPLLQAEEVRGGEPGGAEHWLGGLIRLVGIFPPVRRCGAYLAASPACTVTTPSPPSPSCAQVRHIFGRIASLYSDALAATMDSLLPRGEAWEERRRANVLFILQVRAW